MAFLNYTLNSISIITQHHPSMDLALFHRCWFPDQLSIFIKQFFLIVPHRINTLSSHLCGDHDPNSSINKLWIPCTSLDFYCHLTFICYCINIYIGVYLFIPNILFFVDVDKVGLLSSIQCSRHSS